MKVCTKFLFSELAQVFLLFHYYSYISSSFSFLIIIIIIINYYYYYYILILIVIVILIFFCYFQRYIGQLWHSSFLVSLVFITLLHLLRSSFSHFSHFSLFLFFFLLSSFLFSFFFFFSLSHYFFSFSSGIRTSLINLISFCIFFGFFNLLEVSKIYVKMVVQREQLLVFSKVIFSSLSFLFLLFLSPFSPLSLLFLSPFILKFRFLGSREKRGGGKESRGERGKSSSRDCG